MKILYILSGTLGVTESEIIKFSISSPYRYKKYTIPKRNGSGVREIAHPSKELKFIQRIIQREFKKYLPVDSCAMAYRDRLSVRDNASRHQLNSYLLKMDFRNFFPSITPELFNNKLDAAGLDVSEMDRHLISNFCFLRYRKGGALSLSIGAPTSPAISNFVMTDFDQEISNICKSIGVVYTRYADDLTFSTQFKNRLADVPRIVKKTLREKGYYNIQVNDQKTVFSSKGHNRHVTGVTITNDGRLSLGRNRKRLISSMVHHYSLGKLSDVDKERLKGLIAYGGYIEPEFVERLKAKYSEEVIQNIIK